MLENSPMINVSPDQYSQHELLLNEHAKDGLLLRFDNPIVSRILEGDTMTKQSEMKDVKAARATGKKSTASRSPTIGGIRKIMRRAHTPEGLVLHYETRLRTFLGIDMTLDEDDDWQVIDKDEGMFSPFASDMLFDDGDMVVLTKALLRVQQSVCEKSPEIAAGIKNSLVAEWQIQDSFTRLIVHTMCRYYGLVSFSDTLDCGKSVVQVCHPRFFKEAEAVNTPKLTFHDFLYNQSC
ncbi:hypothetical protein COEREDRAFT_80271 [Coemansia reversa NRRL 1564]|uniref:R3H domain-containing protein n=1 Tax=Coemansia reversa (strain ATCC 12441 / NRRL 1564) TaxID=763665 RepID=A0A2G5BG51_COERN|nr:hypothetical protein COEREDRAFT_80271 [Coemansia reversa NRRL 1564]|eukprot:PIA17973.1 hypothetical protein COEREDRAFT_80271 [Coemansia reversa NRRL 1564]